MKNTNTASLLADLREGRNLSTQVQSQLILLLSGPAILAQLSVTIMQLIDAGMAGSLGADAAASIGLVSSSTWLIHGSCTGAVYGFSVQCAQAIGAKDKNAVCLSRQGLYLVLAIGLLIGLLGILLSPYIPVWLGGESSILSDSTKYLAVFCLSLPFVLLNSWAVQMLQSAGNTRLPSLIQIVMCFLDVLFNYLFIFIMDLGVMGAALGTCLAEVCSSLFLSYHVLFKDPFLKGSLKPHYTRTSIRRARQIGLPASIEQIITGSSYVMFTRIVSSLGSISIAANSFAITAESLCYMPGYGCAAAASVIIGQCSGAGRIDLQKQMAWRICRIGVFMMTLSGVAMFILAPYLMGMLTPVPEIAQLGIQVLRIEALAEPMYGASIVITGILRGKGDTFWPAILNLLSIWGVRIPLAALLSVPLGLFGAWIAMNIELNFRGLIFLIRLKKTFSKDSGMKTNTM